VLRLIDALDDLDDVQGVYSNFDVARRHLGVDRSLSLSRRCVRSVVVAIKSGDPAPDFTLPGTGGVTTRWPRSEGIR